MKTRKLIAILIFLSPYLAKSQDVSELQQLKASTDSIRTANKNYQLIIVRTVDNKLVKVVDGNWPKSILTTYNILVLDEQTLIVGIYPYSESGDWSRQHTYYFDNLGRTFAYEHQLNAFNSICTDMLRRNTLIFYDRNSNELTNSYRQTDKNGAEITDDSCVFNYPYDHQPYSNIEELKNKEGIKSW